MYDIEDIKNRIDLNGLGDELMETSPKEIDDPVLATLWEEAKALIDEIRTYLDEYEDDPSVDRYNEYQDYDEENDE